MAPVAAEPELPGLFCPGRRDAGVPGAAWLSRAVGRGPPRRRSR